MADDPRPAGSGARHRRRDRTLGDRQGANATRLAENKIEDAQPHAAWRGGSHAVSPLSPALAGWSGADDRAGVFLQRDLLHLRAGADRFLRHRLEPGRLVSAAVRGRQFSGAAAARTAVRHARTTDHDHADLWRFRYSAGHIGLSVRDRRAERADPDHRLDGDFLLRLAGGECRLSDRQRNLSAGSPRAGDRAVLCHRHRNRRRGRPGIAGRA